MAPPEPTSAALTIREVVTFLLSSEVGTAASLLALILTVRVLWNIKTLRAHFMFTARLPQLLEELQRNTNALEQSFSLQEDRSDVVDIEMARCQANLKSLMLKVGGSTKESVKEIKVSVEKYLQSEPRSKFLARGIHTKLNGLVQELRNLHEDTKWSE